jgi:hypothetical protein
VGATQLGGEDTHPTQGRIVTWVFAVGLARLSVVALRCVKARIRCQSNQFYVSRHQLRACHYRTILKKRFIEWQVVTTTAATEV